MKTIPTLIIVVALTFISVLLLTATIQYTTDLISVRTQPENSFSSDLNVTDLSNNTGGHSSNDSGSMISKSQNNMNGLGSMKIPALGLGGGKNGGPNDPLSNNLLLLLIVLAALIILAVIGYLVWRRRKAAKKAPAAEAEGKAAEGPEYFEGDYRIWFPQINAPLPIAWDASERLEMVIEYKEGVSGDAILYIDGKVAREIAAEHGGVHIALELEKGDHKVLVSPKAGSSGSSWARVRIVDYREEIVRLFNELYKNHRSGIAGDPDDMTPREIERAIAEGLPEPKRKKLGTVVTIFELASYSLHGMRRGDYEMMYLSKMDVT